MIGNSPPNPCPSSHQELSTGAGSLCDIGIGRAQASGDGEGSSRRWAIGTGGGDRSGGDGRDLLAVSDHLPIGAKAHRPGCRDSDGDRVRDTKDQGIGREGDGGGCRAGGDGDRCSGALGEVIAICCLGGGDGTDAR